MRVLILHSRYRSGAVSGENRVVEDEARLLRKGGHEVGVYAPGLDELGPIDLIRSAATTIWSLGAAKKVAEAVERHHPDVVHVHNLFPALSPAVLRAVPDEVACVMTLHNYRLLCLPGTLLRDGRVCEDCLGRSPWPGVVHGCYQGSVGASGVLASSLQLHRTIGSFRRVDLFA
ncbi:MAG: glycosyltransferase, partial [Actinomycetota bacterium]|nr:glycosyltransferase [Actinomycetota bacterium]